ncbi:MAG: hypothetical protein LBQ95_01180 [Lachnospiraceae bacterium]|jgi:hypothetical protein|nr:hypothetical protein [Lachnospiraceae bacterium]
MFAIDYSIEIEEKLPEVLMESIKELEKLDKAEDEVNYITVMEAFEVDAKGYCNCGRITERTYRNILRKYCLEV